MSTFIFDSNQENNVVTLYCIKDFQTFIINITININNNDEINNNINNNNYGINYYLFQNESNEQCLFERTNCNINIIDVIQGNHEIRTINQYRDNNYNQNLLDNMVWLNILGRLALD